jgi:hypothetical protein
VKAVRGSRAHRRRRPRAFFPFAFSFIDTSMLFVFVFTFFLFSSSDESGFFFFLFLHALPFAPALSYSPLPPSSHASTSHDDYQGRVMASRHMFSLATFYTIALGGLS